MLINVDRLPGIADPFVAHCPRSQVPAVDDILGQIALLRLVLILYSTVSEPIKKGGGEEEERA